MTNQELRVSRLEREIHETEKAFVALMNSGMEVPYVLEYLSDRIGSLGSCLTLCQAMAGLGKSTSGAFC